MVAKPISGLRDAMIGRRIRNSYREFMTGDTGHISMFKQACWYSWVYKPARARGEKYGWLFIENDVAVGYGGISLEDGRWWLTAGLVPEARGRGLGGQIFAFLTYMAMGLGNEAWLRVYDWNREARKLYEKLGYEYVAATEDVFVMAKRNKNRFPYTVV